MLKIKNEKILGCAISLLAVNYIGYQTLPQWPAKTLIRILAIVLVGICIIQLTQKKIPLGAFITIEMQVVAILFSDEFLSNINLLIASFICCAAKNISKEKFAKLCCQASLLSLLFYLILLLSREIQFIDYTVGLRMRNTMGFSNVNAAAQFFLSITMLFILEKNSITTWCVYLLVNVVVYRFTNSRTALATALLFLGIYLVCVFLRKIRKLEIWKITTYIVVFAVFLSPFALAIMQYYFTDLNVLLSARPQIFAETIASMSLKNVFLGGALAEVDNAPMCILLSEGVFVLSCVFVMFFKVIGNFEKINNLYIAYIGAFLFMGMMEGTWIRIEIISSLMMWKILWDTNFPCEKIQEK